MANVLHRTTLQYLERVNTPDYPEEDWVINPDFSPVSGVDSCYWKLTEDTLSVMSLEEQEVVNSGLLPSYKTSKILEIDDRTDELVIQGFVYSGLNFSLTQSSQTSLMGLNQVRNESAIDYPIKWNTADDTDHIDLYTSDAVLDFYMTAVGTYKYYMDSGIVFKDQVIAATTMSGVDAVVDDR